MNKTKLLSDIASNLFMLSNNIQRFADGFGSETDEELSSASSKAETPAITIEQIRAVLAEKSQAGLTDKVRALLTKFGAARLSKIDPGKFSELMKAAEELK